MFVKAALSLPPNPPPHRTPTPPYRRHTHTHTLTHIPLSSLVPHIYFSLYTNDKYTFPSTQTAQITKLDPLPLCLYVKVSQEPDSGLIVAECCPVGVPEITGCVSGSINAGRGLHFNLHQNRRYHIEATGVFIKTMGFKTSRMGNTKFYNKSRLSRLLVKYKLFE